MCVVFKKDTKDYLVIKNGEASFIGKYTEATRINPGTLNAIIRNFRLGWIANQLTEIQGNPFTDF